MKINNDYDLFFRVHKILFPIKLLLSFRYINSSALNCIQMTTWNKIILIAFFDKVVLSIISYFWSICTFIIVWIVWLRTISKFVFCSLAGKHYLPECCAKRSNHFPALSSRKIVYDTRPQRKYSRFRYGQNARYLEHLYFCGSVS